MSSAGQKGEIPQTHRTILLPGKPTTKPYANDQEALPRASDVDRDSRTSSEGWKPMIDRRQSWNEEDRKHELQAWLLGVEEGKETGFTESSHEVS
ncbi:hypothetical protein BDV32DRAFT_114961 [Aspergillus pseudonomiae]|uniref:Uncharacterized protein n=1 Tax=Aspergillus pseudonomiae TaxID=1506151 RepID=A0A5N6II65_9EURO|nr:uncharacterized protein BDV37DRAFT_237534 [Aspergillus pseudonomiae]KAB8266046.1 hypothetical protein BDV32DRAFT_114961 [Aspergillus pseudonomiae]KAE8408912.1 hypothetical protein BDV37DRAFT_237534 [Aspergillus pseudonomiae]